MPYGKWGWEGENKADKGEMAGSCNVTRCQKEGAVWYNRGTYKYYCGSCARAINYCKPEDFEEKGYLCQFSDEAMQALEAKA